DLRFLLLDQFFHNGMIILFPDVNNLIEILGNEWNDGFEGGFMEIKIKLSFSKMLIPACPGLGLGI
ncbi:MAG: hypothetical protein WBN03_06070, partial [Desulfobacterales bacterium]